MAQNLSFQAAVALAQSGDREAQYALSSVLHERGQVEESLQWLRRAAAQQLAAAQLTLAAFLIDGRHCPREQQQALDLLTPLATTDIQANLLLSELHGFTGLGGTDRHMGLRFLLGAARLGDAGAMRQLGLLAIAHGRSDCALPLLAAAARRADAAAAYALGCCDAQGIAAAAPSGARLEQSVRRESKPDRAPMPSVPIDWLALSDALPQLAGDLPLPTAQILHDGPLIRRLPAVVHPILLDTLINLAAPLVQRSKIVDARTGEARIDPMRNSSHVTLGPRQHDHVLEALERCTSRITGLPALHTEFMQLLRYRVGEEFKPHVDYFNDGPGAYQSLADGGQRAQTVLTYLNEDYGGGATCFPALGLEIKGRRGDMLHFHNVDAQGRGHKSTLHSGIAVAAGEKWLLSQWIRSEPYPPRVRW